MSEVSSIPEIEEENKVVPRMEEGNESVAQMEEENKDGVGEHKDEEAEVLDEKKYGNCEGPDSKYLKLVSSDGITFIIEKRFALESGTIKAMLIGPGQFGENQTNEIFFEAIPSHILNEVCKYLMYKARYTNKTSEIPEFPIADEIAVDLLLAASFLDC